MSENRVVQRLEHMISAADRIADYVARGRRTYDDDPALRDAIVYQITVLGEAAKGALEADPSLAQHYSAVEWSPVARMRDRLIHGYWKTSADIVWATATKDVPTLRVAVEAIVSEMRKQDAG